MANLMGQMQKALQERPQGAVPRNTIPNPQEEIKAITGIVLAEPSVPLPPLSSSSNEVERDPETITDQVLPESTIRVPPPVVQLSPVSSPSEPPKRNPHQPLIPYPSRLNKEKLQDKFDIQVHKFFQMFKKLHFNISLTEALAFIPKYHKMLKDLLSDKAKLLGLSNISLTENCSAVLLKKLPEKLGDSGKFLIPCVFPELEKYMALADLCANINLMPLYETLLEDGFTLRLPHKHGNESINMINFINITCEDRFDEVLKIHKLIHCLSGSPTPSDLVVESLSPSHIPCRDSDSLAEETDIILSHFNDSSPNYKTFCFDIEKKSSGSTTSCSYHSLPEYESFYFDVNHIEEKSSGSTTSHSNLSLPEYESFHFELSIDPLPPADRSDSHHEEFADEFAHIISSPEYDCFYFDIEPYPGELTKPFEENISDTLTKDLKIHDLNDFPLFLSDCDSIFSEKFSEIDLLVLFPFGNKEKKFDPRIFTINGVHSKRFSILLLDDFSSILFVRDFLFLTDPSEIETFLSFPFGNKDKVFDPGILRNNIPSDESKVQIEVLSVLWGNRLPILDGSLPLSR
ncbi:hypothetical protein Tco_0724448 [Tanacetum coccineum]